MLCKICGNEFRQFFATNQLKMRECYICRVLEVEALPGVWVDHEENYDEN